jgi:glutamate carboxypeptidase
MERYMRTYSQEYLPRLKVLQDELLRRLELLVNIDSGTGQIEGIQRIMEYLKGWLAALGFSVSLHEVEEFGPNLVARRQGKGLLRVLLVGHVDTVYSAGSALARPFERSEGLVYGPGTIDMKAGVLMGIGAVTALLEAGFEEYGELCFVLNNDEEIGSSGSAELLRKVAQQVDVGLVLEGSRDANIITRARKGADKYVLTVRGVPAHSGAEPFKGRSAVIEMAHKILAIHNLNTLYPGVTFNVTRISSSEPLNVVPDLASCHISVRAHTEQKLQAAASALELIASGSNVPSTHSLLQRNRGRSPYETTPEILRLVEMARIEGEALGLSIVAESKGGLSDANLLVEAGLPALDSLGPVGGGMHDLSREFLRADSLSLRGALLAGLIHRLCLSESTGE